MSQDEFFSFLVRALSTEPEQKLLEFQRIQIFAGLPNRYKMIWYKVALYDPRVRRGGCVPKTVYGIHWRATFCIVCWPPVGGLWRGGTDTVAGGGLPTSRSVRTCHSCHPATSLSLSLSVSALSVLLGCLLSHVCPRVRALCVSCTARIALSVTHARGRETYALFHKRVSDTPALSLSLSLSLTLSLNLPRGKRANTNRRLPCMSLHASTQYAARERGAACERAHAHTPMPHSRTRVHDTQPRMQ